MIQHDAIIARTFLSSKSPMIVRNMIPIQPDLSLTIIWKNAAEKKEPCISIGTSLVIQLKPVSKGINGPNPAIVVPTIIGPNYIRKQVYDVYVYNIYEYVDIQHVDIQHLPKG